MTLQHLGAVRVIVLRDSQHKQPLNKAEKTATAPRHQASRCRFQLLIWATEHLNRRGSDLLGADHLQTLLWRERMRSDVDCNSV